MNTVNYNLEKPIDGTKSWGSILNSNMDKIDTELKNINDDLDITGFIEDAGEETVIVDYNIAVDLQNQTTNNANSINEVKSQLDDKATKVPIIYYFDKDFSDISDTDMSAKLLAVLDRVNTSGGGYLVFNKGKYNFASSIIIPSMINITLIGSSSLYSNNNGTIFNYTGTGNFIDFQSIQNVEVKKICFQGNFQSNQTGVIIDSAISSNFYDCSFRGFNVDLLINDYAYLRFDRCSIQAYTSQYGIHLTGTNYPEFLYFNNCQIDGGYPVSGSPTLIYIEGGNYIYFNECDICNTNGKAILIHGDNGLGDVYFDKCTIMHIYGGIEIGNATTPYYHVKNVNFNNCLWIFNGATGEIATGFLINNMSNSYLMEVNVRGLCLRASQTVTIPTYILNFAGGSKVRGQFEISQTNYTIDQLSFIGGYLASYYKIILPEDVLRTTGKFTITGSNIDTYTLTITNKSPYTTGTLPCLINWAGDSLNGQNTLYTFSSRCNSTQGGNLTITVKFTANIPSGTTVYLYYWIGNQLQLT